MSEENVVLRNPKNNRRKNTDGYRTDSGCFEDVDVTLASRHSPTSDSPSSESVVVEREVVATSDHGSLESRHSSDHVDVCPNSSSLTDECADDKDFHALLKRLADITNNPGDLYRLCFSSRLSFCGHVGNAEDEGFFVRTAEEAQNDNNMVIQANKCTNCEISNDVHSESTERHGGSASNGQQCVELLSLLSSFMVKAKENPNVFNHSSLGSSLVGQLSSLLSTLEEAKKNPSQENESHPIAPGQQAFPTNPQPSTPASHLLAPECTGPCTEKKSPLFSDNQEEQTSLSNQRKGDKVLSVPGPETPIASQDASAVNDGIADFTLNTQNPDPLFSSAPVLLPTRQRKDDISPVSEAKTQSTSTDFEKPHMTLRNPSDRHNKLTSSSSQTEELETSLPVSNLKTSFAITHVNKEIGKSDLTLKDLSDNQDEQTSLLDQREDSDRISDLNITDPRPSASSATDSDDVVTNGRRAVKPYSWDYGDIWEKELERAKSSESFQNGVEEGRNFASRKDPGKDLLPSFEEIRDELFHNAGFLSDNGSRSDGAKRRSRSADARSTLQDDNMWPEYHNTPSNMHSPFVRTVYQNEARPTSGLRRSWSSHHIGGDTVMVNVDWTHGRQMRVISGSAGEYQGFDDVRAQIIKEAVVKTSTFRGSKPWSVLKRRPSGLRRRSAGIMARNQSFRLNTSDESRESARALLESARGARGSSRARSDHDSESSDSPYVSATSSDCLTTATDDSSSVTSSQYYAASSLPSSPSVSNRNSACFSDTSTSDGSDIRRVVFQSSSSESVPRQLYTRRFDPPTTRGMSLDQRFGYIQKYDCVPNEGVETTLLKGTLVNTSDLQNGKSRSQPTIPKKWHGDRLMPPLLVRSESDLNHLTKVQFVGDSYSRSRISKNVRYTRNRSESPSPVGPRPAHTRVVSCEIVQSDNRKRDVYTKVNITEPLNDEEAKIPDGRSTKLGHPSTRRSWHGQSPTRPSSRYSPNYNNNAPVNGPTRFSSSSSSMQERQIRRSQVENQVSATLVAVDNHQRNTRMHWSTGSLRLSTSERPRILSDTVFMNRRHGYQNVNCNVPPNSKHGRGSNIGRLQAIFGQSSDVGTRSGCRRSPPDYMTAIKHSQGLQRRGNHSFSSGNEKHLASANKAFPTGRNLPAERNRFQSQPQDDIAHIVKETSFVGPSTFTKYQSSSFPSFSRTRRSRSLNEKDTMSRRRLHDSDVYRRRAMEISQSNHNYGEYVNQFSRCDSDTTALRRPERSRRYSEGATRHPARHDVPVSGGVVDVSYCDPRRESIREGTYSIVSAESARVGEKSDEACPPYGPRRRGHTPRHVNEERNSLKNGCKTENRNSFNDFNARECNRSCNTFTQNVISGKGAPVVALQDGCRTQHGRTFKDFDKGGRHEINKTCTQIVSSGKGVSVDQKKIAESKCEQVEFVEPVIDVSPILHHKDVDGTNSVVLSTLECRKIDQSDAVNSPVFSCCSKDESVGVVLTNTDIDGSNSFVPEMTEYRKIDQIYAAGSSVSSHGSKDESQGDVFTALPKRDIDSINLVVPPIMKCRKDAVNPSVSSNGNINESKGVSPSLANERISNPCTVFPSVSLNRKTDEATAIISAQELPFENTDESKRVVSFRLAYSKKDETDSIDSCQVVPYNQSDEASEVISAAQLEHRNIETTRVIFPHSPYGKKDKTEKRHSFQTFPYKQIDEVDALVAPLLQGEDMDYSSSVISSYGKQGETNITASQHTLPYKQLDEVNVHIAPLSQHKNNEDSRTSVVSSYGKRGNANMTTSQRALPYKQVDEIDELVSPLSQHKKIDERSSVVTPVLQKQTKSEPGVEHTSVLRNWPGDRVCSAVPNQEQQDAAVVVLSPVLPNRKAHDKTNEVNVFIDYRNKRPVSVEFADEEVPFLRNLGSTSRTSKKEKQNGGDEKAGRSNKSYSVSNIDFPNQMEKNAKNEVGVTRQRLSRRDRHEQAMLSKRVRSLQNEHQAIPGSIQRPSPEPYRRDSTIIYTDARASFGSDTDSTSRESTVSSSGSDMTVILHDDMDISVDDLRQLTESGSKIGIEIAPIEVETGDELVDSPNTEKLPPAMEISKNFTKYPKRVPDNVEAKSESILPKEALEIKAHPPQKLNKNKTPKLVIDGHERSSHDNLQASSYNMQSSCSSVASSRVSSKSTGAEDSSKGKHSPKNVEGGKGFFSRLKSFRNSFRGKKFDSTSPEKRGKKSKNSTKNVKEREELFNETETMSQTFPVADGNANLVSNSRNRTKSDARVENSEGTAAKGDLSRRSYDVFRHQSGNLRSVVGVKSVSSDHLNAYRINNTPFMNEITAKSLEVLVETCI